MAPNSFLTGAPGPVFRDKTHGDVKTAKPTKKNLIFVSMFEDFFKFSKRLKNVTMSFISKNGSGGAGQKRICSHGGLFRELFRFLLTFDDFFGPL